MPTFFATSIPDALFEAAQIDGASQFQIFFKIVLPLGKPILIAMGLLSGLGYWNDWTNGLYYIRDTKLYRLRGDIQQICQLINIHIPTLGDQHEELVVPRVTG